MENNKLETISNLFEGKENGIKHNYEYAILTNEIYQSWSGMKASEYKEHKNIRKESLRDNMTDIEVALTDLNKFYVYNIEKWC